MKLICRALALLFSSALLDSTALRAQSERPRSWFDLKGGIAYESSGGSNFASATALDLTLAGSFRLTGSTAFQLAGDDFTSISGNSLVCVHNPGNGGCTNVGGDRFQAMGVAASIAVISSDGQSPAWTASFGAGPYWVGSSGQTSLGLRATIERRLTASKTNGLTATGGVLVLPMGPSAPISLFSFGLGLRVW
jgi:hypothetical protein